MAIRVKLSIISWCGCHLCVCFYKGTHSTQSRYCFFLGSTLLFFVALSLELWHHRRIYNEERETCVCTGRRVVVVGHHPSFFFFLSILLFFIYFPCVPLNFLLFFLTRRRGDSPCKRLFTWHPNLFFSTSFFFFWLEFGTNKTWKGNSAWIKNLRARVIRFIRFGDPGRPSTTNKKSRAHTHKYKRRWSVLDV